MGASCLLCPCPTHPGPLGGPVSLSVLPGWTEVDLEGSLRLGEAGCVSSGLGAVWEPREWVSVPRGPEGSVFPVGLLLLPGTKAAAMTGGGSKTGCCPYP